LRVLLVDDSLTDRLLAEEAFALLEQRYTLVTAASGIEALSALTAVDAVLPDLVLLDVNMAGMDGFTVLSIINAHPTLRALPVLMLTTSTADHDVARAYALHASAYMPKSINFQQFSEQIQSLMSFWAKSKLMTWPTLLDK
jgi:CheY-like chemotaxis protein